MVKSWQAKPIYYEALAMNDIVTDANGTVLGTITLSNYTQPQVNIIRYIQVDGNNGAKYFGKYAVSKGNKVALKRCIEKSRKKLTQTSGDRRREGFGVNS